VWVPHGITSPVSKPAPVWAPLSTGPQFLPANMLQRWLPRGSQPPSDIYLFRHGVFHGLQVGICSTMDLHGLQGNSLPHHGLLHGLQGNLCSSVWSTSSPSSFIDLVSAELFLSHRLTPFTHSGFGCFFFPFLTMLSQRCYHHC